MCKGYYCMEVNTINNIGFGATLQAPLAKRAVNRSLLKAPKSELKTLCGPAEKQKAQKWLTVYAATNTGIAAGLAQFPGADVAWLASVEAAMTLHIFNGIYGFKLSKSAMESLSAAAKGTAGGLLAFFVASKAVTWIPFIGNFINAGTAMLVTKALGEWLIDKAEETDKARKRGEKIDDFIKRIESYKKK